MSRIEYHAHYGTVFRAYTDLVGGVQAHRPPDLHDDFFAADCVEFGGWHATEIRPTLGRFAGYDCIPINTVPESQTQLDPALLETVTWDEPTTETNS